MMNSRFIKHLSLRIGLIYICIFILITSSIVLIIDATSRKQTAMFIHPILETKMQIFSDAYNRFGYSKINHMIHFRDKKTFNYILRENGKVVYSSLKNFKQIKKRNSKSHKSKLGLVVYKDYKLDDYLGISKNLNKNLNLTILLNVELLENKRSFTHIMAKISIGISILGLLIIGWLIYTLRQRLYFVNDSLANIIKFSSLDKRVKVSGNSDEVDELSKNINEVLDHIESLANKKRLMANNIAHDLRTPLTRVSNTINKHFKDLTPESQEEITEQIDNMLEIFDSILRISKIDSKQPLKLELNNINEMLNDVFDFYSPLAENKGLSTDIELDENLLMICDKSLICQAVANCLDNAIKYTKSGSIKLEAIKVEDILSIKIIDTGIGIPKNKVDDVTQPFFRLDDARTSSGVGLGLSLVSSIIKAHNAKIEIKPNKEVGTIIELNFKI